MSQRECLSNKKKKTEREKEEKKVLRRLQIKGVESPAPGDHLAFGNSGKGGEKKRERNPHAPLLQGGLHVIEELQAVAKFSELRENQRVDV